MSRRGDRAECRRCARLPPPSSASPFADAVADAALVRAPPKRRASFALGRSRGVSPLTASALARKALEEGDARDASDSDEDWRSARSAQTTRSSVDDTGDTGASETAGNLAFETFDGTSPDLRDFWDFSRRSYEDARFDTRDFDTRHPSLARHERSRQLEMDASSSVLGRAQPHARTCATADVEEREKSRFEENAETRAAFAALERATADFEDDALASAARDGASEEERCVGSGSSTTETMPMPHERDDDENENDARETKDETRRKKPTRASLWRRNDANDTNTARRSRSRLGKIGEGARVFSALRAAMRRAGGVLDLTAFKGTPIKWHAPHSALLAHACGESTLRRSKQVGETARLTRERFRTEEVQNTRDASGLRRRTGIRSDESDDVVVVDKDWLARRPPRAARLFTSLWHSFVRSDANQEDTDGLEARPSSAAASERALPPAHARMLAVVAAVLADCEPPALFKKPFNPVLGETARHELGFVHGGSVASVLEQVSHHPPVTAFHSTYRAPIRSRDAVLRNTEEGGKTKRVDFTKKKKPNASDGFAAFGHFRPRPSLRGFPFAGKVHIDIEGTRTFRVPIREWKRGNVETSGGSTLEGPGSIPSGGDAATRAGGLRHEDYVTNYVGFEWLFFPTPRARTRAGQAHVVRCDRTGLVAEIEHRGSKGTEIIGTVYGTQVRHTGDDFLAAGPGEKTKREELKTALYALRGRVDGRVVATATSPASPNVTEPFVVYDAVVAAHHEATSVAFDVAFDFDTAIDPKGSRATWRAVANAMRAKPAPAWDAARRAKLRVEAEERAARAAPGFNFEPRFFERERSTGAWVLRADVAEEEPRRAPLGEGGWV